MKPSRRIFLPVVSNNSCAVIVLCVRVYVNVDMSRFSYVCVCVCVCARVVAAATANFFVWCFQQFVALWLSCVCVCLYSSIYVFIH